MRAEDGRPARPPHLPTLDGLRGLAALFVLFSHVHVFGLPQPVPTALGVWGVLLFFVLSGFLLGHLYLERPFTRATVTGYGIARVARIVPLYYLVVIASWLIGNTLAPDFVYRLGDVELLRQLSFTGSAYVFWSIAPEFQFYAVFPLLWWAVARARAGNPLPLAAVLAGAALLFLFQPWFPGIVFASKLHIFLAGVGLAVLRRAVAPRLADTRLLLGLQLVALVLLALLLLPAGTFGELLYASTHERLVNVYYGDPRRLLLVALVIFPLSFGSKPVSALLANPVARGIGNASFSIYLLHEPVIWLLARLGLLAPLPGPAALAVAVVAVCLVSLASYRLLETPSRSVVRDWLDARLRARPAPAMPLERAP